MNTPVCDFVRDYACKTRGRFHMPGHKGTGPLGFEKYDITEISGADSLFEAAGIIRESEMNASALFGCPTFYSAEGSSLSVRAMLYLAVQGVNKPKVLAARNAHRAFMYAAALLDFEIAWLYPGDGGSFLSCPVTAEDVERAIDAEKPCALYITSPDYLGNIADVRGIAEVCARKGVKLLVDCAHGAYLKFLEHSLHPMDLGADMCAASAHKTLPVLTGGAYLHVKPRYAAGAKRALEMFASTSPSYLILQSLDSVNTYLETLRERYGCFLPEVGSLRKALTGRGWSLGGDEAAKLTFDCKKYGYTGTELAGLLEERGMYAEFCDADNLVLMLSPENTREELERLKRVLTALPRRTEITVKPPVPRPHKAVMSPRKALMSETETVSVCEAEGRVMAGACAGCPPAVPIAVCGEEIDAEAVKAFLYYGTDEITVVKTE